MLMAFSGLVLATATSNIGAVHQHLIRHYVLQATDVAAAGGAYAPAL